MNASLHLGSKDLDRKLTFATAYFIIDKDDRHAFNVSGVL